MNARSLVVVAILLVLGVALWAAIYYGTAKSSDGSSISSPFSEFSATGMVRTEYSNYTIKVYSKLSFSGSSVASWILDAQVDYTDSHNRNFRHVYTNGLVFYGEMVGSDHNISVCQLFDQQKVLDEGSTSFVPTKIENPSPVYVCPQCNVWSLTLAQETFLLLETGGVPQNVISRDQTIYVTSFTRDRTFVAPTIPASARALCDGNAGGPATPPANMNYSVQPQTAEALPSEAVSEERVSSQVSRQLKKLIEERSTVVHNVQDLRIMHGEDSPLAQSKVAFVTQDVCDTSRVGNGYCDAACNVATFNFDGGDCCPGCCLSARNKPYACGSNRFDCKPGSCGNRPCLFLHGLGCPGPRNGTFTQSKPLGASSLLLADYWGNLEYELKGICNTFIYNFHDTINYGWTDAILQDTYYNYAKAVQQQGGVIFAHSMANMILGGACMYNSAKCDVKWYMLAGPIRGSSVANTADLITRIFGFSVGGVYSLRTDTPGLGTATTRRGDLSRTIAEKSLLKGAACGTSAYGSGGLAGLGLYAVGRIVYGQVCTGGYSWFFNICLSWSDVLNDGLVGLDECRYYTYNSGGTWYNWFIGKASFSNVRDSLWFLSAGNHLDMATAAGNQDGIMDWVRNMARRG